MTWPDPDARLPRWSRRFLAVLLQKEDRRYALADLEEEFERRAADDGVSEARWWYRRQALRSIAPALMERLLRFMRRRWSGFAREFLTISPGPDVRQAVRIVTQTPGLAAMAIVTLALGVAAPATMFSIATGILRDLPFESPDRLVSVDRTDPVKGRADIGVTGTDFSAWRKRQTTFEGLAGVDRAIMQLNDTESRAVRYEGAAITPGGFELLRVRPVLGRGFVPADVRPGSVPVAILSHQIWDRHYAQDPAVLGRTIRINGVQRTVVGIMPDRFHFPRMEHIWVPLPTDPGNDAAPFEVFGRLLDDVSMETAQSEFDVIAAGLGSAFPATHGNLGVRIQGYARAGIGGDVGFVMLYAMTLVLSFLLIIACVNVANLLLARAIDRTREVTVRMALGAGRGRIVRELLAESTLVALMGGAVGVVLAFGAVAWFNARLGPEINMFWVVVKVDLRVLLFSAVLVAAAALCAGVLPAIQASSVDMSVALKSGSRSATAQGAGRISRVLVAVEVALSCAMLILSALMVKGVVAATNRSAVFEPRGVFTARLDLREFEYPDPQDRRQFVHELEARLESLPAVEGVAVGTRMPGRGGFWRELRLEGAGDEEVAGRVQWFAVTNDFFSTFRIATVEGRGLTEADSQRGAPVVVVNPAFVERYLPDGEIFGRRIRVGAAGADPEWLEIVGLVDDAGVTTEQGQEHPGVYAPLSLAVPEVLALGLRTSGDPIALAPAVREVVASINPNLPVHESMTLEDVMASELVAENTLGGLFGAFGMVALVMAVVGLYGVVASGVSRRRREVGIRRALGAQVGGVLWVVLRGSITSLAWGVPFGIGLAMLLAPALGDALFGTSPTDPMIYAAIPLILVASAVAATLVPSLRAARVDPLTALRAEL